LRKTGIGGHLSLGKAPTQSVPRLFRKAEFGLDKFILVQKSRIHYIEAGRGEPTILIPGSQSMCRDWNSLLPLLAVEYRLLELDFGAGPIQGEADLVAGIVQQMDLGKVNLIGGANGGTAIFDFAARYPEMVNRVVSIEGDIIKPEKTGIERARTPWHKITIARKTPSGMAEEAKSIKSPILYLYGTKSDFGGILLEKNIEYLKTYLSHAWIVALEGRIQELVIRKPAEVANLILEFLHKKPSR
jgi:pimeloyl-ACP methyl ester carboxylesterase